jgi:hypothetical protein
MSEAEHKVACKWDEDKAPELGDAKRIVEFINRHHSVHEKVRLIVRCHGGVSRSAAVAKWAGEFYRVPLPQLGDGIHLLDGANSRVLRLIAKAAGHL